MSLVSIILPARNAEATIENSIKSVLIQNYEDFELLIVVNDSKDKTLEIANSYDDKRIRVLESSAGIVPALNVGLQNSKGKYIARQDADDVWYQDKLKLQVERLDVGDVDILGTQMCIKENGKNDAYTSYPELHNDCVLWLINGKNPIGHPTVMMKKTIFDKVGGYWEFFPFAEDLDLWTRSIPHFKFSNLNFIGIQYNFVPNPKYNPNVTKILSNYYSSLYGIKK